MKKIFTCFLILLVGKFGFPQSWVEPGAQWYFGSASPWFQGYTKITYTGDTTINGKQCNILEKYQYGYPEWSSVPFGSLFGREYVYEENQKVFWFKNNAFFTLYDFNATAGDSWPISGDSLMCDSTGTVTVDSTSKMVINGDTLKVLYITCEQGSAWSFGYTATIVQKIGCLRYLFPSQSCISDIDEGSGLRCYSDSNAWNYETGIASSCDFTIGFEEVIQNDLISISPNPAADFLYIQQQKYGNAQLKVFDTTGRLVMENLNFSSNGIDLKSFNNGVYFLKYSIDQNSFVKRFAVQR